MTAEEREAALADWQTLLDRLKADPTLPLPAHGSEHWPLRLRAESVTGTLAMEALADKLGVVNSTARLTSDDGWPVAELDGWAGTVRVHVVADVAPVMPPLTDEGVITRSYALGGAA